MKDCVMKTVTNAQENAADILASAKDMNEARSAAQCEAAAAAEIDDSEI